MKRKTIRVLIKYPGERVKPAVLENDLLPLQKAVGGYIETVTVTKDMVILCNEEGRLLGMPYNCRILGVDFVGPIVFAGVKKDKFTDAPIADPAELERLFPGLRMKGEDEA